MATILAFTHFVKVYDIFTYTTQWLLPYQFFQNRMGSIPGDSSNRRPMEHSRVPGSYKHPGAQGSFLCPEVVHEGSEQEGDLSQNRQLDCSSISEQQGRYPLPSVTPLDAGDMEVE